jgi:UDP-N-acetylmuramate--alanine ligase
MPSHPAPARAAAALNAHPLDALAGAAGRTALLVGVNGTGMRGLARLLLQACWTVYGADSHPPGPSDPLVREGLRIWPAAAPPPVSWAVRSVAVPLADVDFSTATARGARSALYPEMLGLISRMRRVIAVAGSHGKSTTSAWIAFGLRRAGRQAGFLVGAPSTQLGGSSDWGDPAEPLVLESCEYARSFHFLKPWSVALTNVDAEHPDTYPGGLPEVTEAFAAFLGACSAEGRVYASPEAPDLTKCTPAAWQAAPSLPADWKVGLPGEHNRRNGALAAAVLRGQGLDEADVRAAVAEFRGCARRLEEIGTRRGALIVSDYAHHPVEVRATLQAASERWPERPIYAVFQPHQAQRFHAYREQFAPALDEADRLLLLEIYRARDPAELRASVAELVPELIRRRARPLAVVQEMDSARAVLDAWLRPGDVVLCLGAGDVDAFARSLA